MEESDRPTLIWAHSTIGFGSPEANTAKVHGEPMSEDHAGLTKNYYEWDCTPTFRIPDEALANYRKALDRGREAETAWTRRFEAYRKQFPELAERFTMMMSGRLPAGWEKSVPVFAAAEEMATRDAGGKVMNAVAKRFEGCLVGGSADLAPSTKTILKDFGHIGPGEFRRDEHALRRARARDGGHPQRPGAARRIHPVRRDVHGVRGLHAPDDPASRRSPSCR